MNRQAGAPASGVERSTSSARSLKIIFTCFFSTMRCLSMHFIA